MTAVHSCLGCGYWWLSQGLSSLSGPSWPTIRPSNLHRKKVWATLLSAIEDGYGTDIE